MNEQTCDMSSTVPLSVKCVPKRNVSASSVEVVGIPFALVMVVILEVKPLVMSSALIAEYLKLGEKDVMPVVGERGLIPGKV